ncbi:MAG: hypothetical protein AAB778_00105 [Patescibacteria group bacterium]
MKFSIRLLYLYLFSFIGLIITVIGCIRLIQLGIKVYIFKDADTYEYARPVLVEGQKQVDFEEDKKIQERENKRQRQREVAESVAMLLVGIPLYKYHWKLIKKENG